MHCINKADYNIFFGDQWVILNVIRTPGPENHYSLKDTHYFSFRKTAKATPFYLQYFFKKTQNKYKQEKNFKFKENSLLNWEN